MAARARLNFFFARSKFLPRGAMNPNSKQIFQNFASNKPKLFCLPCVFSVKSAVKQRLPSFIVAEEGASVKIRVVGVSALKIVVRDGV